MSVESNESNVVYKLSYKDQQYTHVEVNPYGKDASTIMETTMNQIARNIDTDKDLKILFDLIDKDEILEARKKLDLLREKISNDPELSRAEALISFLE